jgi:hypothetical protein
MSQSPSFRDNALKDVIDEGVHDTHCSLGDSSLWMNLSQNFVDVGRISLSSFSFPYLVDLSTPSLGVLAADLGVFEAGTFLL